MIDLRTVPFAARYVLGATILLVGATRQGRSQDARYPWGAVRPGQVLRFRTAGTIVTGRFDGTIADSALRIAACSGVPCGALGGPDLFRLSGVRDVHFRRGTRVGEGIVTGALVGALGGAAIALVFGDAARSGAGPRAFAGTVLGGVAGLLVGGAIGVALPRWVRFAPVHWGIAGPLSAVVRTGIVLHILAGSFRPAAAQGVFLVTATDPLAGRLQVEFGGTNRSGALDGDVTITLLANGLRCDPESGASQ